jgi:hypothetical protein
MAILLVGTLFIGVPRDVFDAVCLGVGMPDDERRTNFLLDYHLAYARVTVDGGDIDVVAPEDGFLSLWADNSLFIVTPAALCPDGCTLSRINPL